MTELYDPQLCYILDGFLLLYGLVITGMYIREKFFKSHAKPEDEAIYSDLKKDAERGMARRGDTNDTYQPLNPRPSGDMYKELPVKKERRRNRNEQVYQDLNSATKDTYDSLQMQPLPPANPSPRSRPPPSPLLRSPLPLEPLKRPVLMMA